jgi:hypothetical protein
MATTRSRKRASTKRTNSGVRWLSPEEGRQYFDEQARKRLGISGEEFLRRLDAGEYDGTPDDPEHWPIIELSLMTGFAR